MFVRLSTPHGQDRKVCGCELLAVQGIDFPLQQRVKDAGKFLFSDSELTDLAGNAFSAAVVVPLLSSLVAAAPICQALHFNREVGSSAMQGTAVAALADGGSDVECEDSDNNQTVDGSDADAEVDDVDDGEGLESECDEASQET